MSIIDSLHLNDSQLRAATTAGDVVVTAGAGSGKTSTLVGRYLWLLENHTPLRGIVAITFTEKAAREMRNRIRRAIDDWLAQAVDPPQRAFWEAAFTDLDAARIGTIHSLCAQILRQQPVEAAQWGAPPGLAVLEEGRAGVLRARAVQEALAWAAVDESASYLFTALREAGLRAALTALLSRRLDSEAALARLGSEPLARWRGVLLDWLTGQSAAPEWQGALDDLAGLQASDPSDLMEVARRQVLEHAVAAARAQQQGDVAALLAELAALRAATTTNGRKGNWPGETLSVAREAMRCLRGRFDRTMGPFKSTAWTVDESVAALLDPLRATYQHALDAYAAARRAENSLDFDDLEAGALALLRQPTVRARWQQALQAVLVDEFQDTNERQRELVYALSGFADSRLPIRDSNGAGGGLFVVGDAKQSIYRFRGADVTVFRRVQQDVERAGGTVVLLDLTFRTHQPLVEQSNRLLAAVLGKEEQPQRPFAVPFAALRAARTVPSTAARPPFVEFHLGLGDSAAQGRQAAAAALTARLAELQAGEGFGWGDMALLFRASTTFPVYEDALEQAGIPFVTVAGRGFYERPEIRDLLNALLAVADPSDDLALVGLLRSPAVGLSDAALYRLRFPPPSLVARESGGPCPIWPLLRHPALDEILSADELARALRGRELVDELHGMAGRAPVAALLKTLLDRGHHRAARQGMRNGTRAQRNIDKLLTDAHISGLVSVREFAEYVHTLRDVGVRESEAPSEAGSAVQLMTVHKAKGLEFPLVVIADAAHGGGGQAGSVLLDDELGLTVALKDEDERRPVAYRLAVLRDDEREAAQEQRLLYVAATRAREKLLVSGHVGLLKSGRLSLGGWLELLGAACGLDEVEMGGPPEQPQPLALADGLGGVLYPWQERPPGADGTPSDRPAGRPPSLDLLAPVAAPAVSAGDDKWEEREREPPRRVWRIVPRADRPRGPAWVVGSLVHAALRYWRFPDRPGFVEFVRPYALEAGLTDNQEIQETIALARRLLARFQAHPLYGQIERAERRHEVAYSVEADGAVRNRVIDLLVRLEEHWTVVEFKTDRLTTSAEMHEHTRRMGYDRQVSEYIAAAGRLLGERPRALLVWLSVGGEVVVAEVTREPDCGGMGSCSFEILW